MEKIKTKVYKNGDTEVVESYTYKYDVKNESLFFLLKMIINAVVLLIASNLFKSMYIESFLYAFIASLIISALNQTIKPILIFLTLPITIMSMGVLYPIVNVIILKLTALLLGSAFNLSGWIIPFFISLFISFMNIIFEKSILGRRK